MTRERLGSDRGERRIAWQNWKVRTAAFSVALCTLLVCSAAAVTGLLFLPPGFSAFAAPDAILGRDARHFGDQKRSISLKPPARGLDEGLKLRDIPVRDDVSPASGADTFTNTAGAARAVAPRPAARRWKLPAEMPRLSSVSVRADEFGRMELTELPDLSSQLGRMTAGRGKNGEVVFMSINPELNEFVERIVRNAPASEIAAVVMEPKSGRIIALAQKSRTVKNLALHAGFPAASLFKVITAAAAVEAGGASPLSEVRFRGGNYTLSEANYLPNAKTDRRSMSLSEALGLSCNPVFGRVALSYLSAPLLRHYAQSFGFNQSIGFDIPLSRSSALIPQGKYEFSRTAAGFGDVYISPIHAATLMSGVANSGRLPRPSLVDAVLDKDGWELYRSKPQVLRNSIRPETAKKLLRMMEFTTTKGTSRREFMTARGPLLPHSVAAKTGTLRGNFPKGINNWFIGAAPAHAPTVAVAIIVVNPSTSSKASRLGRMVIEKVLQH